MTRIRLLTAEVANQIAAGEVIERPASVVKELLENSLDAGATSITVSVDFGGLNKIKISDNGRGIMHDDLVLAITSHATSKITKLDDLYTNISMGFRGEALASIASISKIIITSKPENQETAMSLSTLSDSNKIAISPAARNKGTTIEINDLFYNAPVRKQFLKSEKTEYQAIDMVVKKFALSEPGIAITFNHNDRNIFSLPKADSEKTLMMRVQKLLGKQFVDSSIFIKRAHGQLKLEGFISNANYQRSQNDKQWFYINRRMVKDKLMQHAFNRAYDSLIYPGRYPSCILYLSLPGSDIDVNVHPAKHEVRFKDTRNVHDLITSTLKDALITSGINIDKIESAVNVIENKAQNIIENITIAPSFKIKNFDSYVQEAQFTNETITARVESLVNKKNLSETFCPPIINENTKIANFRTSGDFIILNSQFVIIFINADPFLVDIVAVQKIIITLNLKKQTIPYKLRKLVVPIKYYLDEPSILVLNNLQENLNAIGLQWNLVDESNIVLRTIPKDLAQLDFKIFIKLLCKKKTNTLEELVKIMTQCQFIDAFMLSVEEQTNIINYVHQELGKIKKATAWAVPFNQELCCNLIRKKHV